MDRHLRIRHVQVQTISWCNRSCAFCPSQKFEIERASMPIAAYERILDELRRIDFTGRFSPYLNNESLLDKRLVDLIGMARRSLPASMLFISTNGDGLNADRAAAMFAAGLDSLTINCYDNHGHRVRRVQAMADDLCREVPGLRRADDATFRQMVTCNGDGSRRKICVRDCTGFRVDNMTNIAGNVPGAEIPRQPLKLGCYRPFEQLHVLYNGEVVLCHCDWKGEVVFGNINNQPLAEIYNGRMAEHYRERLTNLDRQLTLCRHCDFSGTMD
jgi:radical SAM protein with 4Fe4S-binding SPASM domain